MSLREGGNSADWIEQAVFTSAETDRSAGYQVVATSPGVREIDARELAVWGPSHDALLETAPGAVSFNFHPLPSGAYCVSRTTPAGWEYSGRGGLRVYTQCLVVPPAVLARFANNPFALLRAALGRAALRMYDKVPARLEPIQLPGRAAMVDATLLARLSVSPGVDWLAALVQSVLRSAGVALVGGPPAEHLVAGILNCLPAPCRTEISFSTGLKFSSQRPFHVVALSTDARQQQRIERQYNVSVLRLDQPPPESLSPADPWPRLIHRVLSSGCVAFLAEQLSAHREPLTPPELSALGGRLLEHFETTAADSGPAEVPGGRTRRPGLVRPGPREPHAGADNWEHSPEAPASGVPPARDGIQQAHAAHRRFGSAESPAGVSGPRPPGPSKSLSCTNAQMLEKLERLDDLVYAAISGSEAALEEFRTAWPRLRAELDEDLLAESREQYLRYALKIWEQCVRPDGLREPSQAVPSLDVLCLLFDEN